VTPLPPARGCCWPTTTPASGRRCGTCWRRTGFEIVGESGDGADAVAMASQLEPDIVVVDLRMPVLNGLDATRLIREAVLAARAG
jgi:DNA-binding NarL/FixJ family response regulator